MSATPSQKQSSGSQAFEEGVDVGDHSPAGRAVDIGHGLGGNGVRREDLSHGARDFYDGVAFLRDFCGNEAIEESLDRDGIPRD